MPVSMNAFKLNNSLGTVITKNLLCHNGSLTKFHFLPFYQAVVRKTEMNKSYGMVSAESKKDKRSVEDIQKDIRAKKKMKLNGGPEEQKS
jgi:hypothetical protein